MVSGVQSRQDSKERFANGHSAIKPVDYAVLDDKRLAFGTDDSLKLADTKHVLRAGYDEDKCRNVLVRYCAHIPRNYQYKDGVQQIFLILREHLGDENLDLTGGVLYELIEIDCDHTDDPGAAFQRWRHDHMSRYHDLELPHVPHMMTITSSIIPTEKLTHWRSKHPERYSFVLSDSSPLTERFSVERSCIRNRKAWLIDNTFYVSSRTEGTLPMHTPNPKEFHEMQWRSQHNDRGRLIDEREVPISVSDRGSYWTRLGTADTKRAAASPEEHSRESQLRSSLINKLVDKMLPSALLFDSGSVSKARCSSTGHTSIPLPDGCHVPNAIFARKYQLVAQGDPLPSHLPIRQMPVAESKATETIVAAAKLGFLQSERAWHFHGPFTPQLGYDGGLDYRWESYEATLGALKFAPETPQHHSCKGSSSDETDRRAAPTTADPYTRARRRGSHFGFDSAVDVHQHNNGYGDVSNTPTLIPSRTDDAPFSDHYKVSPPTQPARSQDSSTEPPASLSRKVLKCDR
ncbi:hypothetical protein BJ170DRAFT_590110 [Xylariales sp. AK1849]|nr:hypothetical protein BJ170DRAFT_590110 [Xylariales sp. AK1849]